MKSLPLQNKTRRIGAPVNWDHSKDGICHTLEVHDRDGWMISVWEPSPAELAQLIAGKPIHLAISGTPRTQHPVVSLWVEE